MRSSIQNAKTKNFSEQLTSENSTKKVRQYSADYLNFGFVRDVTDETKPYCLLCCNSLCNDSMRPTKLVGHLKNSGHPEHSEKPLEYFKRLNDQNLKSKQKSLDTMFKTQISMNERGLQASYELSFLLARKSLLMAKNC